MDIQTLVDLSHNLAIQKGFWEEGRNFGEMIALCHSELSEALEQSRLGFTPGFEYHDGDKPCGIPSELADCVIRIMDICGHYEIDLENVILDKLAYNSQREYRHGKQF